MPSYIFPESAARALSRVADYAEWRKRPRGVVPRLDVDAEAARAVVTSALQGAAADAVWLGADQVMVGLGGTLVELMKDVQVRIQPLTDVDARDMVRSIKGYPLLQGWRGSPPADIAALEDLLLRVSALAGKLPEVAEMDLNPVRVLPPGEGAIVVDARILLLRAVS